MGLLRRAMNQQAYAKIGILGFAGAGKSFTACSLAIGLCELSGNKTASYFDTETGSDFLLPRFEAAGIDLYVHKGRAFIDLCEYLRECEREGVGTVIIDSITHTWRDITQSYARKLGRKRLQFQDWMVVKDEWGTFTDLFVNSKLHIVMCGRAGYEYDFQEDEDGNKELVKTGVRMKVESELGFEPSLLIEMERVRTKNQSKEWVRRATILKDRTDQLDGKVFDDPVFEDLMPHVARLRLGGDHLGVDTERGSDDLFEKPDYTYAGLKRRAAIALEKISELFLLHGLDGTARESQRKRAELLIEVFGTSAKTAMENLHAEKLEEGLKQLRVLLGEEVTPEKPPADALPSVEPEEWDMVVTLAKNNEWPEGYVRIWLEKEKGKQPDHEVLISAMDKFGKRNPQPEGQPV